jgi:hypothetical protein
MTPIKEDSVGKQNPIFVAKDVKRQNEKYRDNYTPQQQINAAKIAEFLYSAYGCRPRVFVNYRKEYIAIKVCSPTTSEKNDDRVVQFNKTILAPNALKKVEGGLVYEFRYI